MTFSLLVHDPQSQIWCGVAATGNLCVGGWVLHGHAQAGICASQGETPSTLWADRVLDQQRAGTSATDAIASTVNADRGNASRQISAIDTSGQCAAYTGSGNGSYCGHFIENNIVVSGNILKDSEVLTQMLITLTTSIEKPIIERAMTALKAGAEAGGDTRGLKSAALLMVGPSFAPMSLRIDYSETPITDLECLVGRALEPGYVAWTKTVPTEERPEGSVSEEPLTAAGSRQ